MIRSKGLLAIAALVALFMLAMNAASRAQTAPPTPQVSALSQKLMQEINSNLQCTEQSVTLQQQLVSAQAEVKRLTDKYEAKPEEKAEPKK